MSKPFNLDEKTALPIASVLLFGIGALKILLFSNHYNLAVTNYISFANLLEYTFEILRGLLYSAIPVVAFIIVKDRLIPILKMPVVVCISFASLCVSILVFIYCYEFLPMTYCANFWTKYLLEFGIFCAGICLKSQKWSGNFEIVKLALLVCFLYGFLKVESKYVIQAIDKGGEERVSKIVFKNNITKDTSIITTKGNYIILTTSDFVFLYNDTTKHVTTIPMANVFLLVDK